MYLIGSYGSWKYKIAKASYLLFKPSSEASLNMTERGNHFSNSRNQQWFKRKRYINLI